MSILAISSFSLLVKVMHFVFFFCQKSLARYFINDASQSCNFQQCILKISFTLLVMDSGLLDLCTNVNVYGMHKMW